MAPLILHHAPSFPSSEGPRSARQQIDTDQPEFRPDPGADGFAALCPETHQVKDRLFPSQRAHRPRSPYLARPVED